MPDRTDVVYEYDGSFEGLLTCVFESYAKKENPAGIYAGFAPANLFYANRFIETDAKKAERVLRSIPVKISARAEEWVRLCFWSCEERKEKLILDFLRLGYEKGRRVTDMLHEEPVSAVQKAVLHMSNESHLLKGFIRFSDYGGALTAEIEPKNFVLPLLAPHFCDRYRNEHFLIYDKTYAAALVYRPRQSAIIPVQHFELPQPGQSELAYRRLWKRFYDTIAIADRDNPRCRMSHMPKRYWNCMTEFAADQTGRAEISGHKESVNPTIALF